MTPNKGLSLFFARETFLLKDFGCPAGIKRGPMRYHIGTTSFQLKSPSSDKVRSCSLRKLLCGKNSTTRISSLSRVSRWTPLNLSQNGYPVAGYGNTSGRIRARTAPTWWVHPYPYLILSNPLPLPQLLGVSNGLDYLHSQEIIHGDLKGVRAMVNPA